VEAATMKLEVLPDRFIDVNGVRTRYWAAGENGSAVVLIHGFGGFVETWAYNISPLAGLHRVYAMDLLGFGQTDKKPLVRDLNILVRFIKDFMAALNIENASLAGNSLGGGLALQFSLDYPEKVDKLVLVANAGMGREVCSEFRACFLPVMDGLFTRQSKNGLSRLLSVLVYNPALISPEFHWISNKYNTSDGAPKSLLSALTAGINLFGQKSTLIRPLLERLNTVKAPTLVIWGKDDHVIPVSHAGIAAGHIPGARLELFDNCGHMPQFEYPEKFNKLVLDFLS